MAEELETLLVRIDASAEALRRELRKADKSVDQFERKTSKHLAKVDKAFASFGRSALAFGTAWLAGNAASGFEETTKSIQALDARILQLTGSQKGLADTNQWLQDTADRLGKEILSLTDGYARMLPLVNGGVLSTEEARKAQLGLLDTATALGAGTAQLGQVMYGLSQALSSPIVRAEEFNQVVEPLPGLMQAMDRAAGLSSGGFRQLVVSGKVTAEFFKNTLIKAFDEFAGAAERLADKNEAAENRLSNAWTDLVRNLAPAADLTAEAIGLVTNQLIRLNDVIATFKADGTGAGLDGLGDLLLDRLTPFGLIADAYSKMQADLVAMSLRHGGPLGPIPPAGVTKRQKQSTARVMAVPVAPHVLDIPNSMGLDIRPRAKPFDAAAEFLANQDEIGKSARETLRQYEIDADRAAGRVAEAITKSAADQKAALAEIPGFTAEMVEEASGYIDEATAAALDDLNDKIEANQQAMESWLHSVSDGFADAILGADSFGDALERLALQLAKSEISNLIFGGLTGKSGGGSIIGGLLKGVAGRAGGGPVTAGTPYIVGERAPELFVPNTSGYIRPDAGGGVVVYQTIAPQLAGNAVTPEDLQAMAMITKQSAIAAVESRMRRARH